jgi:hypothetical protein
MCWYKMRQLDLTISIEMLKHTSQQKSGMLGHRCKIYPFQKPSHPQLLLPVMPVQDYINCYFQHTNQCSLEILTSVKHNSRKRHAYARYPETSIKLSMQSHIILTLIPTNLFHFNLILANKKKHSNVPQSLKPFRFHPKFGFLICIGACFAEFDKKSHRFGDLNQKNKK